MIDLVQISHDGFSRESILRGKVRIYDDTTCSWCGQNKMDKQGKYLWQYYVESDGYGAQPQRISGKFCGIDCMRTYNS